MAQASSIGGNGPLLSFLGGANSALQPHRGGRWWQIMMEHTSRRRQCGRSGHSNRSGRSANLVHKRARAKVLRGIAAGLSNDRQAVENVIYGVHEWSAFKGDDLSEMTAYVGLNKMPEPVTVSTCIPKE